MSNKQKISLLLSLINTFMMFLIMIWLWSIPWLAGDEKFMIWATGLFKTEAREIPDPGDYFLINVSNDLELVDKYDDFGMPEGNQVITDRNKLAQLFRIFNEQDPNIKYILCDIHFKDESDHDSLLYSQLRKRKDLILSYHLNDSGFPDYPIFIEINNGLSDYVIANVFEGIYKFQLYFKDSLKLTPLKIYESINDLESSSFGPFVRFGDWNTINHFILNYRILQKDIYDPDVGFNPVNLWELLLLPEEDIASYVEGKFVVIGDFYDKDMHETMFEMTSGPVILLNAYLALEYRDTTIDFWFYLLVSSFFLFLSFVVIYPEDLIEIYIKRRFGKIKWVANLTSFIFYLTFLTLCSVITFLVFNIHINVFFLALYLFLIEKLSNFLSKRIQRKKKD